MTRSQNPPRLYRDIIVHPLGKQKQKPGIESKSAVSLLVLKKTSFRAQLIQIRVPHCLVLFTFALFMKFYQCPNKNLLFEKCSVMKIREPYPS